MKLKILTFALLLFYPQVNYFNRGVAFGSVAAGGALIFTMLLSSKLNLRFKVAEFSLLICFAGMCCLSALLLLFGSDGELGSRNLILNNLLQLALVILFFDISKSDAGRRNIAKVFLLFIGVEFLIVFGQFSYLSVGSGLAPKDDAVAGVITGSFGNPNNESTAVGMAVLALSMFFYSIKKYSLMFAVMLLGFLVVGVTLSRTIFVILALNAVLFIFLGFGKTRISRMGEGLRFLLPAGVLLVCILVLTVSALDSTSVDVLDRSVERISRIDNLDGDDSASFRTISHLRLLENVFNLGYGSFSDLSYGEFFNAGDDWLMKSNPHSFLVEYSFLFGYFGLLIAGALLIILVYLMLTNAEMPLPFRFLAFFALIFAQAVPSSILANSSFFLPFLFLSFYKIPKTM